MPSSHSVMSPEGVDLAWIGETPITVDKNGFCTVDIIISAARAPGVWNMRENTKVVCPDVVSPSLPAQQAASLASLVATENSVNAKHFIVTAQAAEYLRSLNTKNPTYTDDLVKKTNLFCVDLETNREFKNDSTEYQVGIVQPDNHLECQEVSQFQQDILPWFRRLTGEENIKKTKDRYDLAAFNSRVTSPEVIVFTTRKEGKLLGTHTLNLHTSADAPESARFGYLSDLFVAEGLDDKAAFNNQFISSVFAEIVARFPKVKVLSVMAAAGDPSIPIVKCFSHAREAGLIQPFTRAEQERLGVVAQFTLDPKNNGRTHLEPLKPGTLSHLSLLSEMRRQSQQVQQEEKLETAGAKLGNP